MYTCNMVGTINTHRQMGKVYDMICLSRFKKENCNLSQVEVEEVLGFMSDI